MNILIREVTIISPGSTHHGKKMDVLIEGGMITQIKKSIGVKSNYKVLHEDGLCISPGWVDLQAVSGDPGLEFKEDLDSLIACAAAGGFTTVCVHNFNQPALHNKSQIEYIRNKTRNKIVEILPVGTITVDAKGKDLAEMYDMKQSGAVAFSDHKHAISDAGMLMRALQYASNTNSFIITHCNDSSISGSGQMNEGEVSTSLGLKGIPALAEELMVERNISILEYAGGSIHIPTISTKGSLDLVKKAKSAGLHITCGVAAANLLLDDSVLKEFDTNFKLDPPLRTKKDVQALRTGIENGSIDVIVSDHLPQDIESKELEFDLADVGMISLQNAFSMALEALKEKNIDTLISALTDGPRNILSLPLVKVEEGMDADFTLFNMSTKYEWTERENRSHSRNSPFFGQSLQGKVVGIIKGSKSSFN
jgi:dihydroorotase